MPNHVHLLMSPIGENAITTSIGHVKRFSSRKINEVTGKKGSIWQTEVFDRMVRNEENLDAVIRYICKNPKHLSKAMYTLGGEESILASL